MDSRSLGITRTMVPASPYAVLQILRCQGFAAYLVGGCVRDLLLNRTPKDYDVITTADLNQISKQFHRCQVVGQRFPVCRVYIIGSVVEVSSFDTLAKDAEGKEKFLVSHMPKGPAKLDLVLWKNSMHRDFTINSLFFDPFVHTIYDYNDGMKDILELKLRTLVPAQLSFTEDSARILRGLRIAARLGLSLSKEIKSALFKHKSSISRLGQSWEDGLKFARKYGQTLASFEPETLEPYNFVSDDEVAEKVNQLAMLVIDSIDVLVESDSLHKTMMKFTRIQSSGLVIVPKNMGHSTRQLFHVLVHKVETYKKGRTSFEINYDLLRKGDSLETRFALGKIILNTMGGGVDSDSDPIEVNHHVPFSPKNELVNNNEDRKQPPLPLKLNLQLTNAPKKQKLTAKLSSIMQKSPGQNEYQVKQDYRHERVSTKRTNVAGISSDPKNKNHKTNKPEIGVSQSPMQELICMLETVIDDEKSPSQLETQNLEERLENDQEVKVDKSTAEHQTEIQLLETAVGNDVQTNCKKAIEEARDSPAGMTKLNQFLVTFLEEQMQRKKAKLLETSTMTSSSTGTSQTEITPQTCTQHPEEPKTTRQPKKATKVKESSSNVERKKHRVCSYCKEMGHNRTGCPKRKIEEASLPVDTGST